MFYNNVLKWTVMLIFIKEFTCSEYKSDEYLSSVQSECFSSKKIYSCTKYRVARYVWSFATGRTNLFEYNNTNNDFVNNVMLVKLSDPNDVEYFPDAKSFSSKFLYFY